MVESIRKMWRIPELRKKVVYTFLMLVLYRLVSVIPAPGVDISKVNNEMANLPLLDLVNMMTGNSFSQMTIMAMGITPYINASIIMQLLTIAIPALERLSKEEDGRQKINRITRYVTVGLAALQAIGLVRGLGYIKPGALNYILVGVCMAGGTALAMWIGERITEKGVGNGVSLLIFVGIISNLFSGIVSGFSTAVTQGTTSGWVNVIGIIVTCILMTVVVTFVELGERRIPLQIAKQVKGRRVYGGQNTHMSLKVVSVGVLPLIFAYSFLAFPGTIAQLIAPNGGFTQWYVLLLLHQLRSEAAGGAAAAAGRRDPRTAGQERAAVPAEYREPAEPLRRAVPGGAGRCAYAAAAAGGGERAVRGELHPDRCERFAGNHPHHPGRDERARDRYGYGQYRVYVSADAFT